MRMLVFCAWNCDTAIECDVVDLSCGAGRIKCIECGGDGRDKFTPEITGADLKCVDCKGTGRQLVSI